MPRYLAEATEVSAEKDTKAGYKVTVNVRDRVPDDWTDFVLSYAGGNEDRANDWIRSQVVAGENVSARALLRGLEVNAGETKDAFLKRAELEAQAEIDSWNIEKARREGTGVSSRAKAADEIAADFAAGKDPEVIKQKLAAYAAKFGIGQTK